MDTIGVSFLDPLEDYELIHRLGSGTYGDVFKVSEAALAPSCSAGVRAAMLQALAPLCGFREESPR